MRIFYPYIDYFDSYTPPAGSLHFEDPRNASQFPAKAAAIHAFSLFAYGHYLSLTIYSHSWALEALQVIAFGFFPALPLVQLCNNILVVIQKIADGFVGDPIYCFSAALGLFAKTVDLGGDRRPEPPQYLRLVDVDRSDLQQVSTPFSWDNWRNWRWVGRLIGLIVNLILSLLGTVVYVRRVQITYQGATFVANLGIDHRLGWLEIGGLSAVILSIFVYLMGIEGTIRRLPAPIPRLTKANLVNVFFEIATAGFIQDLLMLLTNRYCTIFWLADTIFGPHATGNAFSLWAILFAALIYFRYRRTVYRSSDGALLYFLFFRCTIPTAVRQIVYDVEEIKQIERTYIGPGTIDGLRNTILFSTGGFSEAFGG